MKIRAPRTWGITARLVLVATVPSFLMFVVVSTALYVTGRSEAENAIQERGRLTATALAETSQYAVVSGNLSDLERNVKRLLAADDTIAGIQVLDAERRVLVERGRQAAMDVNTFETPIGVDVPEINVFGQGNEPHVSIPGASPPLFRPGQIAGYARVAMSPAPMLQAMRQRLYWGAAIVLAAMVISIAMGLYFAQQMRSPLRAMLAALRQIRQGSYGVHLGTQARGELGELQAAIVEMARGLGVSRSELEEEVASRTRELQRAVEAAQEADAEKRRLIASGNALVEDERHRIAGEIHDHLNASLIVVRMEVQMIAALASDREDPNASAEIERVAQRIMDTTETLYATARHIVKQLRPEIIDTLGLRGAVEEMVRNYDELHPACSFSFYASADFPNLLGQQAIAAYRLVQEALSNVVKHAKAANASVRLERDGDSGQVLISINDDGNGFDPNERGRGGMGLIGMRERVYAIGGAMTMSSSSVGTSIVIRLPAENEQ